ILIKYNLLFELSEERLTTNISETRTIIKGKTSRLVNYGRRGLWRHGNEVNSDGARSVDFTDLRKDGGDPSGDSHDNSMSKPIVETQNVSPHRQKAGRGDFPQNVNPKRNRTKTVRRQYSKKPSEGDLSMPSIQVTDADDELGTLYGTHYQELMQKHLREAEQQQNQLYNEENERLQQDQEYASQDTTVEQHGVDYPKPAWSGDEYGVEEDSRKTKRREEEWKKIKRQEEEQRIRESKEEEQKKLARQKDNEKEQRSHRRHKKPRDKKHEGENDSEDAQVSHYTPSGYSLTIEMALEQAYCLGICIPNVKMIIALTGFGLFERWFKTTVPNSTVCLNLKENHHPNVSRFDKHLGDVRGPTWWKHCESNGVLFGDIHLSYSDVKIIYISHNDSIKNPIVNVRLIKKTQSILGFHAFTSCDTVSGFCEKGKKSVRDVWKVFLEVASAFLAISSPGNGISKNVDALLERFVVILNARTSCMLNLNDCRRDLFTRKGRTSMKTLPPTKEAPTQHMNRTCFQAGRIWAQALVADIDAPSPSDYRCRFFRVPGAVACPYLRPSHTTRPAGILGNSRRDSKTTANMDKRVSKTVEKASSAHKDPRLKSAWILDEENKQNIRVTHTSSLKSPVNTSTTQRNHYVIKVRCNTSSFTLRHNVIKVRYDTSSFTLRHNVIKKNTPARIGARQLGHSDALRRLSHMTLLGHVTPYGYNLVIIACGIYYSGPEKLLRTGPEKLRRRTAASHTVITT
ncbi:putative iGluR-like protein, partial [Homarus americanus]